ncbi:hypothetical protein [Streptomyces sp. WMMC940]|uniref:hypothetical protein n=1 Tax=Streptomyces sp. WMMC940 TaxID=3015153 RepID=UPI0022B6E171|nr:hypothetical protein [Streptomyces sp. WMMC940]MCZ7461017.1 hypothetical protein [Streptomyces sp. WMMC940]
MTTMRRATPFSDTLLRPAGPVGGIINREQLRRITAKLAKQITDAQNEARRLRPAFDLDAFDGLVGPRSAETWEGLEVPQQRRVLDGLGVRLRVHPVARRGPGFDQSTIELEWVRTGD